MKPKIYALGSGAAEFFEQHVKACAAQRQSGIRALSGLLSLKKKYPDEVINQACIRACHFGCISYQTVKTICEKGLDLLPIEGCEANRAAGCISASKVRDLDEYRRIAALGVISHE
jgi:hypothetical protein